MTPTTVRALEDALTGVMLALVPHETPRGDRVWVQVEHPDKVEGASLRRFYLEIQDPLARFGGAYGPDGMEHDATLMVWAAYTNMKHRELSALRGQDANDIHTAFDTIRDPITPGLVSVEPNGWIAENDEQGKAWGAHSYALVFFGRGVNPP